MTKVFPPLHPEDPRWATLLRGTLLQATLSKHVQYVSMADRRAQAVIAIHAFLIPVALGQVPEHHEAVVFITFGAISVLAAVMCLIPKPYSKSKEDDYGLLHFSGIVHYSEAEYMGHMRELLSDDAALSEHFVYDLYHISRFILKPKFRWIKVAYYSFLIGMFVTLACWLARIW